MELLNCFPKGIDAEQFVRNIIDNSINIDVFLQILDVEPNWIEDNINGNISSLTLMEMLKLSFHNRKYDTILTDIIEIAVDDAIDDLIFKTIISYSTIDIREKMLIILAHKKLKESQLRYLCKTEIAFECYFELAILYYENKNYTLSVLKNFITETLKSKYSYMVKEILNELVNYHSASEEIKYEFAKSLLGGDKTVAKNQSGDGINQGTVNQSGDGSVC